MSSMCIRIICVNGKAAAGDGGWGKAVEMASKAFEASKKMRNKTIRKCLRMVNIGYGNTAASCTDMVSIERTKIRHAKCFEIFSAKDAQRSSVLAM